MVTEPLIPKPALQVYDAVDPSSVAVYTAGAAFSTTGGEPQPRIKHLVDTFYLVILCGIRQTEE